MRLQKYACKTEALVLTRAAGLGKEQSTVPALLRAREIVDLASSLLLRDATGRVIERGAHGESKKERASEYYAVARFEFPLLSLALSLSLRSMHDDGGSIATSRAEAATAAGGTRTQAYREFCKRNVSAVHARIRLCGYSTVLKKKRKEELNTSKSLLGAIERSSRMHVYLQHDKMRCAVEMRHYIEG